MRKNLISFFACFYLLIYTSFLQAQTNSPEITSIFINGATIPQYQQDVAGSVTVVTEKQISEKNQTHLDQLIEGIPGLTAVGGSNRQRFFQIRGIGEFEQYEGAQNPSVGFRIDELDLSGIGGVGSLFDLAQVEVLKGPQPIRYGANALAGIINITTNEPTKYFSSTGSVSLANDEYSALGVALGGPILDNLQYRLSFYMQEQNGFRNNTFLSRDNTNKRDETSLRFKLALQPTDDLDIALNSQLLDFNNGYDAFSINNDFRNESDRPGQDKQLTAGTVLKLRYKAHPKVDIESISSISRSTIDYSYDGDWGNNIFWGVNAPYDYFSDTDKIERFLAQEFRVLSKQEYEHGSTDRWISGLYFEKISEDTAIQQFSNDLVYDALQSDYTAKTYAGYGQYEYGLGAGTALALGFRVDSRYSEYTDSRTNIFSPKETMFGTNIALTHDFTTNQLGFLQVTRGFKGGGFNVSTNTPQDKKEYNPEYLWNLETGIKSTFLDQRLKTNVSVFSMLRREQQIKSALQTDPNDPLSFIYVTDNAARGWNIGLDTDVNYQLGPYTEFFVQAGVLDTKLTSVPQENPYLQNRDMSIAPSWQYSLGARQKLLENLMLRLELNAKDAYYFDDSHNEQSSPSYILNTSLGYTVGSWKISLWGKNILDERYATRGFYFGNEPPNFENKRYVQLGDRALFGVTVAYTY